MTVGDFNRDSRPDLTVSNNTGDNVSVLLNTCAGGSATPTPAGNTATPTRATTGTPATSTRTPVPATVVATGTPTPLASVTATPCTISFSDVQPSDYFYEAIRYLACRNAVSGYSDDTFRPYTSTTRGQLSKIVVLAVGWTINTSGGPHFSDVPTTNPFYPYIETAYRHNIISGYADGTFRWGNNVTRGQLSKMIVVAMQWDIVTSGGPHFIDVPAPDPFYAFIETAYRRNVISGYSDGTFRTGTPATRGQISKIVYLAITNP